MVISLAPYRILMHFEGIPYLFVQLQRRVDGNKSKAGFEQNHHAWKSSLAQPNSAASSADSNPSPCRKRANLEDAAFRIQNLNVSLSPSGLLRFPARFCSAGTTGQLCPKRTKMP